MFIHQYKPVQSITEVEDRMRAARHALATAVADENEAGAITSIANEVAECEGALEVLVTFERVAERLEEGRTEGDEVAHAFELLSIVTDSVTGGAEDTFSGRSNDGRRSRTDGKVKAARAIHHHLRATVERAKRESETAAA